MGGDSETWWKAVRNELGRLSNGIDNQVRATNTIESIIKDKVLKVCKVTYANFVCEYLPLKSLPYSVRLTVGGYRLEYPDDASSPAASRLESNLIFNSIVSYAHRGPRFMSCDLKDFSWKPKCQEHII